jgi:hypothetical protein
MTWIMWNLILVCLETVLVSVQDRCMIYAKHTIVLEIILDTPNGTPRCHGSCESRFGPFGNYVGVGAR